MVRIASVTDGLSNTHFALGDLAGGDRRSSRDDLGRQSRRGFLHDAVHPQRLSRTMFLCFNRGHRQSPARAGRRQHGQSPDICGLVTGDQPSDPGSLCDSQPVQQLACYNQTTKGASSRGRAAGIPAASIPSSATVGPLHEELDQRPDLGRRSGRSTRGEVISSDSY